MTYPDCNPACGLGQAQTCGIVKPVSGMQPPRPLSSNNNTDIYNKKLLPLKEFQDKTSLFSRYMYFNSKFMSIFNFRTYSKIEFKQFSMYNINNILQFF
jgi:hypothetical protein